MLGKNGSILHHHHHDHMMLFARSAEWEPLSEKCKRLSEKSHKYSHCRQEKCFSLSLYPNMNMMIKMMITPMVNVLSLSVDDDDDESINVKMMMMVYIFLSLFCVSLLLS